MAAAENPDTLTVYCNLTDVLMSSGSSRTFDTELVNALKTLQENKVDIVITSNHLTSRVQEMLTPTGLKPKYIIDGGVEGIEELQEALDGEVDLTKSILIDDQGFVISQAVEKGMQGVHCKFFKDTAATIIGLQRALDNIGYAGQPILKV